MKFAIRSEVYFKYLKNNNKFSKSGCPLRSEILAMPSRMHNTNTNPTKSGQMGNQVFGNRKISCLPSSWQECIKFEVGKIIQCTSTSAFGIAATRTIGFTK